MDGTTKYNDIGAHAVTVTGITADGDLIVSSWGKQYVLKLEDIIWLDYEVVPYD